MSIAKVVFLDLYYYLKKKIKNILNVFDIVNQGLTATTSLIIDQAFIQLRRTLLTLIGKQSNVQKLKNIAKILLSESIYCVSSRSRKGRRIR